MKFKIVTDSSANFFHFEDVDNVSVPLKIISGEQEYVDTPELDAARMIQDLQTATGRTSSSCPNTHEWLEAFGDADGIFGITITGKLSGSYSAAMHAREEYLSEHENAKVLIIDSLTAGPELQLLAEKLRELILKGLSFEEIECEILQYQAHTYTLFSLKSLNNLARNGRISPAVAKIAGVLGIYVIGHDNEGTLEPIHKCRGEKRVLKTLADEMAKHGLTDGKVRICHCLAAEAAEKLKDALLEKHPKIDLKICTASALCSYYAEIGGLIIGYEGA